MSRQIFIYSIKRILLIYTCVCIVAVILCNSMSGIFAVRNMKNASRNNLNSQFESADIVFAEKTKNIVILTDIINRLYFKDGVIEMNTGIESVIKSFMDASEDIHGCLVVNNQNDAYRFGLENKEIDLIQLNVMCNKQVDKTGSLVWYNMTSTEVDDSAYIYNKYIIASTKFLSEGVGNSPELYLFLDKNSFSSIIRNDNGESITAIVGQEGNILYSNDEEKYTEIVNASFENMQKVYSSEGGFYSVKSGVRDYEAAVHPMNSMEFRVVKIYPNDMTAQFITRSVAISVFALIILLLIAYYIYKLIFKNYIMQIENVSGRMKQLWNSEEKERMEITSNKEVNMIIEGYNHIADNFNEIINDIKKKEYDKKKYELNALKHQIKPHFLYNTLNSIRILVLSGEQSKVAESIRLLGRILKTMLSGAEQEVKLSEEIDFIKNYISLMQIRFEDCLEVEYAISDEVAECKIPSLVLQPIVENAIEHGLADELSECGDNAKIFIKAVKNTDYLEIEITDNGVGMSKEKLSEVIAKTIVPNEENIGLYNVNSRLNLLYGDKCKICIESKEKLFTSVTIKIPFNYDENL